VEWKTGVVTSFEIIYFLFQNVHEEDNLSFWTHNFPEGLWNLRPIILAIRSAVIDLFGNLSIPIAMMLVAVAEVFIQSKSTLEKPVDYLRHLAPNGNKNRVVKYFHIHAKVNCW